VAFFQFFDLPALLARLQGALGPFGVLWKKGQAVVDALDTLVPRGRDLVEAIIAEAGQWKRFKENAAIKTRVINVGRAIDKSRALIDGIGSSWRAIQDIVKQFKKPLKNPLTEATEVTEEIVTAKSITRLLEAFPRLARGLERASVWLGFAAEFLEQLSAVLDDLKQILDEITRLRLAVEELDTIFLSQKNRRQRIRLPDGNVIRIRVGSLHTAEL